jgi:hypothetical protein
MKTLKNFTPIDVQFDRAREIMTRCERIRKTTMLLRRRYNCLLMVA